jgi:inhibitor of KinA
VTYRVTDVGDACVAIEFEARVDPALNRRAVAAADRVARAGLPGVRDVVATYHAVAVHFDPLEADRDHLVEGLEQAVRSTQGGTARAAGAVHEIPVCYGGEYGPDLLDLARFAGCSEEDVVRRHSDPAYRVYMMGFLPGFAYLGTVDERLRMGRHETPRLRVPAGSVAIAGFQTGVYPLESPGGWRVIGRTWVKPYDERRTDPLLFRTGDEVRFVPVTADRFRREAAA